MNLQDKMDGLFSGNYVLLRIYHESKSPEDITKIIDIQPTATHLKGQKIEHPLVKLPQRNTWFYSTESYVRYKTFSGHLDFLLDQLLPRKSQLEFLINDGAEITVICFWLFKAPTLSKKQSLKLGKLDKRIIISTHS